MLSIKNIFRSQYYEPGAIRNKEKEDKETAEVLTVKKKPYKKVENRIKPVATTLPEEF